MPRHADSRQTLCTEGIGFGLHAAVRCGADDHQMLEQLCRDLTPPGAGRQALTTQSRRASRMGAAGALARRIW